VFPVAKREEQGGEGARRLSLSEGSVENQWEVLSAWGRNPTGKVLANVSDPGEVKICLCFFDDRTKMVEKSLSFGFGVGKPVSELVNFSDDLRSDDREPSPKSLLS